jgi:hypothetical protein
VDHHAAPIQARLVVDVIEGAESGVRTAVLAAPRRQLVWESDRADLALTMWADEWSTQAIIVDGQVLPHGATPPDYTVVLRIEGVPVARTVADEDGCFSLEGLDRGEYEFRLLGADHEIAAGPIDVVAGPERAAGSHA